MMFTWKDKYNSEIRDVEKESEALKDEITKKKVMSK
mgnify:CR=1 FL=1